MTSLTRMLTTTTTTTTRPIAGRSEPSRGADPLTADGRTTGEALDELASEMAEAGRAADAAHLRTALAYIAATA